MLHVLGACSDLLGFISILHSHYCFLISYVVVSHLCHLSRLCALFYLQTYSKFRFNRDDSFIMYMLFGKRTDDKGNWFSQLNRILRIVESV